MNETISTVTFDPDMAEILHLLNQWHADRMAQLRQLSEAADDVVIRMVDPEGQSTRLEGVARQAFKFGIVTAINRFQPLPFRLEAHRPSDVDGEEE